MWISFVAGLIAGGLVVGVGLVLTFAENRGLIDVPEVIFWPLTGAVVFGALFLLFDLVGWRLKGIRSFVGIPDISGSWSLVGKSYDQDHKPKWDWVVNGGVKPCHCGGAKVGHLVARLGA